MQLKPNQGQPGPPDDAVARDLSSDTHVPSNQNVVLSTRTVARTCKLNVH